VSYFCPQNNGIEVISLRGCEFIVADRSAIRTF
jgi:hypothetical protein